MHINQPTGFRCNFFMCVLQYKKKKKKKISKINVVITYLMLLTLIGERIKYFALVVPNDSLNQSQLIQKQNTKTTIRNSKKSDI